VAQENGVEAMLGRLELVQGICTSPTQVAEGFVLDLGHIDRGEGARAPQAGPWESVTPGRFDPIAGLVGAQRWGHDPADLTFLRERAGAPRPTRPRFIDEAKRLALGLQLPAARVDGALARADGAQKDHVGPMILGHVGDRHRLVVDIHADLQGGRMGHG
jgi:hypothetical protein